MSQLTGRKLDVTGTKTLVLTFDDGPSRGVTNRILDYLRDEGIHAGFFLVGKNIAGNEKLLQRMRDEGHTVGNHTWDHRQLVPMARTDMRAVYKEIAATDRLIAPYVRADSHFYFRAPGGAFNPRGTTATAEAMNEYPNLAKYIGPIYWDIGGQIDFVTAEGRLSKTPTDYIASAADWDCWRRDFPVETCAAAYLQEAERRGGGIVLMHDRSDVRAGDSRTYEMIRIMIPEWKKRGYRFITLDEIPGIDVLGERIVY